MTHAVRIGFVACAVVASARFAVAADAAPKEPPGRALYLRYCSACHGPQAKGDGVASSFMRPSPPDLTRLAAEHGGFSDALVVRTIDGRDMPRAHGDPAMPVWGQVLGEEMGEHRHDGSAGIERRVQGRILEITEYVRSVQAK